MRFTSTFLNEIRIRLPVSSVIGKYVKLTKKGKEFIGLSPFNLEKTASFTVNDKKRFYHCFSSGNHGDIFKFLMEIEGLSFYESVKKCAKDAGISIPIYSKFNEKNELKRTSLINIMEITSHFFEQNLQKMIDNKAQKYLLNRKITSEIQFQFKIGYAPSDKYALKKYLINKGINQNQMIEAGLVIVSIKNNETYDRFRDRIIFPITDLHNEIIAFGGRSLSKNTSIKYLNSPETILFHKREIIYNLAKARKSAFNYKNIIVVEGYLDVIAFSRIGIEYSVALLGTAMSIEQLKLLWRIVPEPILCFDGDMAGIKAAFKVMHLALPNIKIGLSLKFILLPDGCDPDDILRVYGADVLKEILKNAKPMDEMIWLNYTQDREFNTPERCAMLEDKIFKAIETIQNSTIIKYYRQSMKNRLFNFFSNKQYLKNIKKYEKIKKNNFYIANELKYSKFNKKNIVTCSNQLKKSALVQNIYNDKLSKEIILLITLIHYPWLISNFFDDVSKLIFLSTDLDSIYKVILEVMSTNPSIDSDSLRTHIKNVGLGQILEYLNKAITLRNFGFLMPNAKQQEILNGWNDIYRQYQGNIINNEIIAAATTFGDEESEENFAKLKGIKAQKERLLCYNDN